jgi:hypothetical protein
MTTLIPRSRRTSLLGGRDGTAAAPRRVRARRSPRARFTLEALEGRQLLSQLDIQVWVDGADNPPAPAPAPSFDVSSSSWSTPQLITNSWTNSSSIPNPTSFDVMNGNATADGSLLGAGAFGSASPSPPSLIPDPSSLNAPGFFSPALNPTAFNPGTNWTAPAINPAATATMGSSDPISSQFTVSGTNTTTNGPEAGTSGLTEADQQLFKDLGNIALGEVLPVYGPASDLYSFHTASTPQEYFNATVDLGLDALKAVASKSVGAPIDAIHTGYDLGAALGNYYNNMQNPPLSLSPAQVATLMSPVNNVSSSPGITSAPIYSTSWLASTNPAFQDPLSTLLSTPIDMTSAPETVSWPDIQTNTLLNDPSSSYATTDGSADSFDNPLSLSLNTAATAFSLPTDLTSSMGPFSAPMPVIPTAAMPTYDSSSLAPSNLAWSPINTSIPMGPVSTPDILTTALPTDSLSPVPQFNVGAPSTSAGPVLDDSPSLLPDLSTFNDPFSFDTAPFDGPSFTSSEDFQPVSIDTTPFSF